MTKRRIPARDDKLVVGSPETTAHARKSRWPAERGLTEKQRIFLDEVRAGTPFELAARKTAPQSKRANKNLVDQLLKSSAVRREVEKWQADTRAKLTAADIKKEDHLLRLHDFAMSNDLKPRDCIAATTQLSRMTGWDAPQKIEAKVEGSLLWQIRNRGKRVQPEQAALPPSQPQP